MPKQYRDSEGKVRSYVDAFVSGGALELAENTEVVATVKGSSLLDDEVVVLDGTVQELASIPATATVARLVVEYTPDASEVGGIRFRELGRNPSADGEFVPGGESVVIGFTHEALEDLRFTLVGAGTGRVLVRYYA